MLPASDPRGRAHFAALIGRFAAELRVRLLSEETPTARDEVPTVEQEGLDRSRHVPAQLAAMLHAAFTAPIAMASSPAISSLGSPPA